MGGVIISETTPRNGHKPIAMRRVDYGHDIDAAGQFAWELGLDGVRRIWLGIPSSLGYVPVALPVNVQMPSGVFAGPVWQWDGNEEAPTITPSAHTYGYWHRWVRAGMLVEA